MNCQSDELDQHKIIHAPPIQSNEPINPLENPIRSLGTSLDKKNTMLPFVPAHMLAQQPIERRWLIEDLWGDQSVGIIGGEPKSCKSFLALDMAVSVASGVPCLRRFRPVQTGRVLLFAAEDPLFTIRRRLEGICQAADISLETLDLQIITAKSLRIDIEEDQQRLMQTISKLRPKMLLLDPFVRLHRIDENASAEVAPVLAYLRDLQREFQLAVIIVHHARKGASKTRGGQALRGSSEFHAWVDGMLYMRRSGSRFTLAVEHRDAPSLDNIPLSLHGRENGLALEVINENEDSGGTDNVSKNKAPIEPELSPSEKVERVLANTSEPMTRNDLRQTCHIRNADLGEILRLLQQQGRIEKTSQGFKLIGNKGKEDGNGEQTKNSLKN